MPHKPEPGKLQQEFIEGQGPSILCAADGLKQGHGRWTQPVVLRLVSQGVSLLGEASSQRGTQLAIALNRIVAILYFCMEKKAACCSE